jgi:hypothetical protein
MIEIEAVLDPIPINIVSHHTYKVLDSLDMLWMCIWVSPYLYIVTIALAVVDHIDDSDDDTHQGHHHTG